MLPIAALYHDCGAVLQLAAIVLHPEVIRATPVTIGTLATQGEALAVLVKGFPIVPVAAHGLPRWGTERIMKDAHALLLGDKLEEVTHRSVLQGEVGAALLLLLFFFGRIIVFPPPPSFPSPPSPSFPSLLVVVVVLESPPLE
eukprot:CAMPEP_0113576304 /NCGR_PEP_ID=MMETSP0015_2-20120614/28222_1 /TAXON_ID=2838 /ORGANISM="Odontella" /LENGTH=142 /DNA_ID=CAMNT_0000479725 /DNA_START=330 /DNA_END=755 /DNA_ORIENTATION=- /assembly_acc=CAM_ASM_000160